MKGVVQISVRVSLRADMAHSWHIVADLTMFDGRVVHWPKSDLGAGILVDEGDMTKGLKRFVDELNEFIEVLP